MNARREGIKVCVLASMFDWFCLILDGQVGRKILPKSIQKRIRNNIKSSYDFDIENEGVQGRPGGGPMRRIPRRGFWGGPYRYKSSSESGQAMVQGKLRVRSRLWSNASRQQVGRTHIRPACRRTVADNIGSPTSKIILQTAKACIKCDFLS